MREPKKQHWEPDLSPIQLFQTAPGIAPFAAPHYEHSEKLSETEMFGSVVDYFYRLQKSQSYWARRLLQAAPEH